MLILAGGGGAKESALLDAVFLKHLNQRSVILYIPVALRAKIPPKDCLKWFNQTYARFKGKVVVGDDLTKLNSLTYDAIYIGGGNTYSLLEEVNNFGFRKKLLLYAKKGIIYGGSAGAIILGTTILTSPDRNTSALKDFSGLDLLQGHAIWPHYVKDQDELIKQFQKKSPVPVIAIPETAGVVVEEAVCTVYGTDSVVLFTKGKRSIKPLEQFRLS